jgi:uncharacterized membrane protein YqjE
MGAYNPSAQQARPFENLGGNDVGDDSTTSRTEGAAASLPHQLSHLVHESIDLVKQEMELAKAELQENIQRAVRGVVELTSGAAFLLVGLAMLMVGAFLGLGLVVPYWASALIVGAVPTLMGLVLVMKGKSDANPKNLELDRSKEELRQTKNLIQERV